MTRTTPLVSIGLPVYNGEPYLREAVDSLLAQTFTDFELILSDNASTDGTAEICREYASRDNRVRYVRNDTNIGLNNNCNQTIHLSTGRYFKLAASDDVCHPELVARCVSVLGENPTVVSTYAKTRFIDSDGRFLAVSDPGFHLMSESPVERLRYVLTSGHWVNFFYGLTRVSDLVQTRLFAPYTSGDYRLLGELSLRGKFFEIPDFLFFRRLHSDSSSQNATDVSWLSDYHKSNGRLPYWSLCLDHAKTILHSDLTASQKISCLRTLGRRAVTSRHQLLGELQMAWKSSAK